MNKHRAGTLLIAAGLLLAATGIALGGYNLWDDQRAGDEAEEALDRINQYLENVVQRPTQAPVPSDGTDAKPGPEPGLDPGPDPDLEPTLDPNREMPVLEIDGYCYIGTISIPSIDLELPVQESWSYPLLKKSPCRYKGSAYLGDMILCAHNYTRHFGPLRRLLPGDEVIFTDIDGNVFRYLVAELETLSPMAIEDMESGEWDLTLFTCTLGGQTRVTVRCNLAEGSALL